MIPIIILQELTWIVKHNKYVFLLLDPMQIIQYNSKLRGSDGYMRISSRGRYALRMMIDITEHDSERWVSIKDISERQGISVKYLEQIVTPLHKSGLLISSRGPQGGYKLARAPETYTAGQILRVIEGSLAPVACLKTEKNHCGRQNICPTIDFWIGLYAVIDQYVDSVTLRDLVSAPHAEGDAIISNKS